MKRLYLIFIILIAMNCYGADGIIIKQEDSFCLPGTEFNISRITTESSKADVIALKGKAKSVKPWDDTRYETWVYDDMTIDFSNNQVLNLETNSNLNKTPSGICPGMKKSKVLDILGIEMVKGKTEYQFVNCDEEQYLVLTFDKSKLVSIGMGIDAP
jgi:hypothetical protein